MNVSHSECVQSVMDHSHTSKCMQYIKLLQLLHSENTKALVKHCLNMYKSGCDKLVLNWFNLIIYSNTSKTLHSLTNEEKIYLQQKLNWKNPKVIKLLYGIYSGNIVKSSLSYALLKCYEKFGTLKLFLKRYIKRYNLGDVYCMWVDILLIDPNFAQKIFDIIHKHPMFFPEILFFRGGSMLWHSLSKHLKYFHDTTVSGSEAYNSEMYTLCKKWNYNNVTNPKLYLFMYNNQYKIKLSSSLAEDIYDTLGVFKCLKMINSKNYNTWWEFVKSSTNPDYRIVLKLKDFPYFFENFDNTSDNKIALKNDFGMMFNYEHINILSRVQVKTYVDKNIAKVYTNAKNSLIAIIQRVTGISRDVIQYVIFDMGM